MPNPTLLTSPIAENGEKNVIPASTGATTGLLDQEHGFQQINELPLQAGGLPPQRKDFNGAFNLLSKILFYAQKGYVFDFDESQDYYAGCIVKDTDGGLYCAKAGVSASSTHPKDDGTNWQLINHGINKKETFTSSGSFTAPVTGTYRITLQGGGGGGAGSSSTTHGYMGGGGGAAGAHLEFYEKLTAGTSYSYTIGAGGTGGSGGASAGTAGSGGTSSITINGNAYVCNGGGGGYAYGNRGGSGEPATATVNGAILFYSTPGHSMSIVRSTNLANGGSGGGPHGGLGGINAGGRVGWYGSGGGGGAYTSIYTNGGNGGDGYITFEYCDI